MAAIDDLISALMNLASSQLSESEKAALTTPASLPKAPGRQGGVNISLFDLKQASRGGRRIYLIDLDLMRQDPMCKEQGANPWLLFKDLMSCGCILDCALDFGAIGTLEDEGGMHLPFQVLYATVMEEELLSQVLGVPMEQIKPIPVGPCEKKEEEAAPALKPVAIVEPMPCGEAPRAASEVQTGESTLRVNLSVLEQLMNLAGEMVLGRNQLMAAVASKDPRAVLAGAQRINLVTSELQEVIMLTRMQPVGKVLDKFPRVVRDLSRELGKEISLRITGRDVEIDRSILEGLSDPLTHMIRNAVDHGIETAALRQNQGKNPTGKLDIQVFHEAGQVVVQIQDDGKGLDVEAITAKALEKGQITGEQARAMSEKEKMALIFLPGLSTAKELSSISGRGVGMDVVKTNLERLGGTIDIESKLGQGSAFIIRLPLTLAIVPSLLVSVEGERFAIPEINVCELIRVSPDQIKQRVEVVGGREVLLLRGKLIPLLRLADALHMGRSFVDPQTGERREDRRENLADRRSRRSTLDGPLAQEASGAVERGPERRKQLASSLNIAVVSAGVLSYGIVVDELQDSMEIVVKPLGRHLKGLREYAGATILGDGGVALILDTAHLASMTGLTSQGGSARAAELQEQSQECFQDRHAFLLFENAPGEHCAVPLEQVARVERVEEGQLERVGGRLTMQCRGVSLPLVRLQDAAQVGNLLPDQNQVVIVFSMGGRELGLLGATPVDSVEVGENLDHRTHRQTGIAGSAIIRGKTTLIVDIHELVSHVLPEFALTGKCPAGTGMDDTPGAGPTLLLAEDSDFFRSQIQRFLESDGYTIIPAVDGETAWQKLLENTASIKGVVSDIEMPGLNGFELVQRIRADGRFDGLPVIAVTSLAGEEDILRGKHMGFSDYQIKLDKERLSESLRQHLAAASNASH